MPRTFKIEDTARNLKAVGSYNEDFDEWTVKFYVDGKRVKKANYFTNDRDDAVATAKHEVARGFRICTPVAA